MGAGSFRIGPRLREARASSGLSQAEIARRVAANGFHDFRAGTASSLELNYREASEAEVRALAELLRVDPDWLTGKSNSAAKTAPAPRGLAVAARDAGTHGNNGPTRSGAATPPAADPRDPPVAAPDRGTDSDPAYRRKLAEHLQMAERMLADSALSPAQWRGWRSYLETLRATLRALA